MSPFSIILGILHIIIARGIRGRYGEQRSAVLECYGTDRPRGRVPIAHRNCPTRFSGHPAPITLATHASAAGV